MQCTALRLRLLGEKMGKEAFNNNDCIKNARDDLRQFAICGLLQTLHSYQNSLDECLHGNKGFGEVVSPLSGWIFDLVRGAGAFVDGDKPGVWKSQKELNHTLSQAGDFSRALYQYQQVGLSAELKTCRRSVVESLAHHQLEAVRELLTKFEHLQVKAPPLDDLK
ncbi:MAG: hypothetical protein S4CHLAM102_11830 [Chlamydiia bacterium]|nr:hypothetical protein [Chlamydiia bacterium]